MKAHSRIHTSILMHSKNNPCFSVTHHPSPFRLLVVNEAGLLALRAGLGPACNRYGLEPLPAESIPEGAKLVACKVVRTCYGGGGSGGSGRLGMICMAMLTPVETESLTGVEEEHSRTDGGTKQGDSAGGPAVRSAAAVAQDSATTAAAAVAAAAAVGGGLLNVYALGGERSFEVERALQRQPQQQLLLSYAPEGIAHTTVWRRVTAVPNFVGGPEGESSGAGVSSIPSPGNNQQRRYRVERGDAVLVWDQDGIVHGYTRWEGDGGRLAADSSTSRGGVGSGSGGGGVAGYAARLRAESRESLETLIPELRGIDGRVSCLSFDAEEDGETSPRRRRRRLFAGCKDSVRCSSLDDVATGWGETTVTSVADPVCDVVFNASPRLAPHDRSVDDAWGGNVAGFACTELDTLAWLVNGGGGGGGGSGGRRGLGSRWCTGKLPLPGVGGDQVTCMGCGNFCRDGSTCVAVGTSLGKVVVYGADIDPGDDATTGVGVADDSGDDEGLAFGLGDADYEDNIDDDKSDSYDATSSLRWDSTSPRPPGAAAAAGGGQHHGRHVAERLGGGGGAHHANNSLSNSNNKNNPRPLLSVRWQRYVPHGVLRMVCGDFNHDGVSELVVATHYGVHVFHPDYREEATRFANTMWALKMLHPKEEDEKYGEASVSTASADDHEETSPLVA